MLYIHGVLMNWRRFYTVFEMVWDIQQSLLALNHQKAYILFGTVVISHLCHCGEAQKVSEFYPFLNSDFWIRDAQLVYSLLFKTEADKPPSTSLEMHWAYRPWSYWFDLQSMMAPSFQSIFLDVLLLPIAYIQWYEGLEFLPSLRWWHLYL